MTLFDTIESAAAKTTGMDRAASSRAELLDEAREVARTIAKSRPSRECTADDVGRHYHERGVNIATELGNAMGSLFKGKEWTFTGRRLPSARVSNHGRELKVWRLV